MFVRRKSIKQVKNSIILDEVAIKIYIASKKSTIMPHFHSLSNIFLEIAFHLLFSNIFKIYLLPIIIIIISILFYICFHASVGWMEFLWWFFFKTSQFCVISGCNLFKIIIDQLGPCFKCSTCCYLAVNFNEPKAIDWVFFFRSLYMPKLSNPCLKTFLHCQHLTSFVTLLISKTDMAHLLYHLHVYWSSSADVTLLQWPRLAVIQHETSDTSWT